MFIYLRYRGRDLPYDQNSGSLPKWLNSSGWAKLKTGACKHPGLLPGNRVQELGPVSSTFPGALFPDCPESWIGSGATQADSHICLCCRWWLNMLSYKAGPTVYPFYYLVFSS